MCSREVFLHEIAILLPKDSLLRVVVPLGKENRGRSYSYDEFGEAYSAAQKILALEEKLHQSNK